MVRQYHTTTNSTPCPAPGAGILGKLSALFELLPAGHLLVHLWEHRYRGRYGYPLQAMWRAYLVSFFLNMGSTNELINRLRCDHPLRELCGLPSKLPDRRTFNRFIQRLKEPHHADMVEQVITQVADKHKEITPDLGDELAIDSTTVRSHCSPHRKSKRSGRTERSDPEAEWGYKNTTQAKEGSKQFIMGFKMHMVSDANYEVPLGCILTPANRSDNPMLVKVMDKVLGQLSWLKPTALMADRGYDAGYNFDYLHRKGILPIIKITDKAGEGKQTKSLYTKDGAPTCIGNVAMDYVRSDPAKGHLYRCAGCEKKGSMKGGVPHCQDEFWQDPSENLRLFGPPNVRRESPAWKAFYDKRYSIERVFRSLKHYRRLERHHIRGFDHIRLHCLMSVLVYSATILVNKQAGLKDKEARWMVERVA